MQVIKNGEPKTLESLVRKQQWEEKINEELEKINTKYLPKNREGVNAKLKN